MIFDKKKIKRKKVKNFYEKIRIKMKNFYFSDIIMLIGLSLLVFSFFIPWFTLPYKGGLTQNIFSNINGIISYISIFLIIKNLFIIFSKQKKEKIKLFFSLKINDIYLYTFSSVLFIILGFNSLFTIKGLIILSSDIIIHSGIIFYIIAGILFSAGTLIKYKQKENNILININEANTVSESKNSKKTIMKLPFE